MKVLVVDDEPTIREILEENLKERGFNVHCIGSFKEAESSLFAEHYDALVLDLMASPTETPGVEILNSLLSGRFLPVVVYSARLGQLSLDVVEGPFISVIDKNLENSYNKVCDEIARFQPFAQTISEIKEQLADRLGQVLRSTASAIWSSVDEEQRADVLRRCAMRHIAVICDHPQDAQVLASERYIFPPIEVARLMQGDILQVTGGDFAPKNFRVVLTPTCDLVSKDLDSICVLTAKCVDFTEYQKKLGIDKSTRPDKRESSLEKSLNNAQNGALFAIPPFAKIITAMAANLRDLEVLRMGRDGGISGCDVSFRRVVSVDSPYRERWAWAYLEIAGRVGIPPVSTDWLRDI